MALKQGTSSVAMIALLLTSMLALAFYIQPSSSASVDWWPQFQHDVCRSGYSTSSAPGAANLIWQASYEDIRYGSWTGVVTCNGRVIATDRVGWVMALNEETGARIWLHQFGIAGSPNEIICTPSTDGNLVYAVTCRDGCLHALSFSDGHEVWSRNIGPSASGSSVPTYTSSPAISQNKVIIGGLGPVTGLGSAAVWAFDKSSGAIVWQFDRTIGNFYSSPAVDETNGRVYIATAHSDESPSNHAQLYCLSLATGSLLYYYTFPNSWVQTTATIANGRVYLPYSPQGQNKLYCFDLNLNLLWSLPAVISQRVGAVDAAYGKIFTGHDCLDAATGSLVWHIGYSEGSGKDYASPTVADGKMYIENYQGCCCYSVSDGSLIWNYNSIGVEYGTPAISNGKVFFTTEAQSGLWAFGTYEVTLTAHCNTEGTDVSVGIAMDGSSTGHSTPYTFSGLVGSHTFTVPNTDGSGHPFVQWSTGQTSTTITVSGPGTYAAYYSGYSVTIKAHCDTEGVDVNVPITKDGSSTGFSTPHTFSGLSGSHIFAVPNIDSNYHSFKQWDTGQIITSISVSNPGGIFTTHYSAVPARIEAVEPCCMNGYIMLTWSNPKLGAYPDASVTSFKIYKGIDTTNPSYFTTVSWSLLYYDDYGVSQGGTVYYYWVTGVNSYGEGPLPIPASTIYSPVPSRSFCPITVYSDPPGGGCLKWDDTRIFRSSQTVGSYSSGGSPQFPIMFQTAAPGYSFVPSSWQSTGAISIDGTTTPSVCYITSLTGSATITGTFTEGSIYTITFVESGLAQGKHWSVTLDHQSIDHVVQSTTDTITFYVDASGQYDFSITSSPGYDCLPTSQGAVKAEENPSIAIAFTTVYGYSPISICEFGLPEGMSWSATCENIIQTSTSNSIKFTFSAGNHRFSFSCTGYIAKPSPVDVPASTDTSVIFIPNSNFYKFSSWDPLGNSYSRSNNIQTVWTGENCYGFVSTSLLYWKHYQKGDISYPYFPLQSTSVSSTSDLDLSGFTESTLNNAGLAIAFHQEYDPERPLNRWTAPDNAQSFNTLKSSLQNGVPKVLNLFSSAWLDNSAHSVLAWGVGQLADGNYAIAVYDPDYCESTHVALYSQTSSVFSYQWPTGYTFNRFAVADARIISESWFNGPITGHFKRPLTGYTLVVADKPVYVVCKDPVTGLYRQDSFTDLGGGNSQTFACGIPGSSGIEEGNFQVYAIPNSQPIDNIHDPGSNESMILISRTDNESGQIVSYGYLIKSTTHEEFLDFEVIPSDSGLSIRAGTNALDASVTFFSADQQCYSISQTLNVSIGARETASFPKFYVKDALSSKNVVGQGYSTDIDINVANQGSSAATFNMTVYANTTVIGTFPNIILAGNSTIAIKLDWNTTSFAMGNYVISAYATLISGETNIADSNCTGNSIFIANVGDLNADGIVDIFDIIIVAADFGRPVDPPLPVMNPNANINDDSIVDIFDLILVAAHFGEASQ